MSAEARVDSADGNSVWLTEGSRVELERLRQKLWAAGIRACIEPRSSCSGGACSIDAELRVLPADVEPALRIVLAT